MYVRFFYYLCLRTKGERVMKTRREEIKGMSKSVQFVCLETDIVIATAVATSLMGIVGVVGEKLGYGKDFVSILFLVYGIVMAVIGIVGLVKHRKIEKS